MIDTILAATAGFGVAYIGGKFVVGLVRLWQSTGTVSVVPVAVVPVAVEPEPVVAVIEEVAVETVPAEEPVIEQVIEQVTVKKGVRELRIDCGKAGVTWKNAHGKGKHMRKAEMEAALGVS